MPYLISLLLICLLGFGAPALAQADAVVQEGVASVSVERRNEPDFILGRILRANELSYDLVDDISLVESDDLNASTDGQRIVITRRLWNVLENDDQRAFVIGHELAHIQLNHVPKTVARRVGIFGLGRLLLRRLIGTPDSRADQLWSAAGQAGLMLLDMKFSREAELAADDRGLTLMAEAGYHPTAAIETLEILNDKSGRGGPEFLRTHPMSESRIESLARKYEGQYFEPGQYNYEKDPWF